MTPCQPMSPDLHLNPNQFMTPCQPRSPDLHLNPNQFMTPCQPRSPDLHLNPNQFMTPCQPRSPDLHLNPTTPCQPRFTTLLQFLYQRDTCNSQRYSRKPIRTNFLHIVHLIVKSIYSQANSHPIARYTP